MRRTVEQVDEIFRKYGKSFNKDKPKKLVFVNAGVAFVVIHNNQTKEFDVTYVDIAGEKETTIYAWSERRIRELIREGQKLC